MAKEQRLIDTNDVKIREKLMMIVCDGLEDGCVGHCNFPHCYRVNNVADQLIENDVVPIVRCKDCVHYNGEGCLNTYGEFEPEQTFFCAYGKRRDKDAVD